MLYQIAQYLVGFLLMCCTVYIWWARICFSCIFSISVTKCCLLSFVFCWALRSVAHHQLSLNILVNDSIIYIYGWTSVLTLFSVSCFVFSWYVALLGLEELSSQPQPNLISFFFFFLWLRALLPVLWVCTCNLYIFNEKNHEGIFVIKPNAMYNTHQSAS